MNVEPDCLVKSLKCPKWGLGRVLAVERNKAVVRFEVGQKKVTVESLRPIETPDGRRVT
jgi:hypothetical protein